MKRVASLLLVLFVAALPALPPALGQGAESLPALLEENGMTQGQAETFEALAGQIEDAALQTELADTIEALMEAGDGGQAVGEVIDGIYHDPNGYTFPMPENWTLQEKQVGPVVVLAGPSDGQALAPSITVLALDAPEQSLLKMTREDIEKLLSGSFENFQMIALEEFEIDGKPARELVCMYGADVSAMIMQYQTHFDYEDKAFVITMTTLAEEAAHDLALETYDALVAEFTIFEGEGNG